MDLAIYSSRIFTGDPRKPWVEALGIRDGIITALGDNEEVRTACPRAEAVELPGRLVTPGLVDAHTHFVAFGLSLGQVDLRVIGRHRVLPKPHPDLGLPAEARGMAVGPRLEPSPMAGRPGTDQRGSG